MPATDANDIQRLSIDTIRGLAMDTVQKANAGHPGTAMALAPLAYTLFKRFLRVEPARHRTGPTATASCSAPATRACCSTRCCTSPATTSGSRISSSSASGARARPGTPSAGTRPGIEVTTGPLGQGVRATPSAWRSPSASSPSASTGPGSEVVDHHTYAICSDGDMMEGVSQEAASIAGHFGLGKLIVCYDDNHITIDGTTAISFDGENHTGALRGRRLARAARRRTPRTSTRSTRALRAAREETERPSFIAIRSHIAYPAPNAVDTAKAHGAPLGEEEVRGDQGRDGLRPRAHVLGRRARVRAHVAARRAARARRREWQERFEPWREALPGAGRRLGPRLGGAVCATAGARRCRRFEAGEEIATRSAGQKTMAAFAEFAPTMIGGAADLVESTKTVFEGAGEFSRVHAGRNVPFGIREHAMGAIVNGAARARRDRQAVRLDVPDVLRLHARRRCGCRR